MKSPYAWTFQPNNHLRKSDIGYLWKAIAIKDERMQQLPRSERHQHPTAHPPRLISEPAIILQRVVRKFCGSGDYIYGNGDSQLICGIYAKRKTSKTGANRWCKARCQGFRDTRVAPSEGRCVFCKEIGA